MCIRDRVSEVFPFQAIFPHSGCFLDAACAFRYRAEIGGAADIAEGWAEFKCPAESISIWTKTDARGREEFKKN